VEGKAKTSFGKKNIFIYLEAIFEIKPKPNQILTKGNELK